MKMDPENDENLVKITDICRACLSRTETMKFLLEDSEEILSLLSKFVTVSNLEIEIGFKYPSYLCTICEEKILSSYEFQQQCQKSNDLIKEYLEVFLKQDTIPSEPESKITLTNLNTSEERNISLELHNTTDTVQLIYEEISNPPYEDSKEYKDEYDEKFQEDLSQAILNLKEKYMGDNECVVCQYQAENHTTLSTHVSTKHKESKDRWCSICNKIFSNIITHLEEHKNDFVCKFCHIKFSSFESIIDHLYKHQATSKHLHDTTETAIQKNEYTQKIDSQDVPKAGSKVLICQFCNKPFYTDSELKKHICNREKRKENRDLVGEIETPNNTSQEEEKYNTLLEEEIIIKADSLPDEFKNFTPVEVPLKNKTLQKMRLKQYSVEDVSKAISIFKGKFYKHVNCIFCNFTAVTNRSLSVHVTRVHSEYKNKWCSSCNKVTDNQTSHNKEVHFEDLKCPFCRKIKNNMGHFMEHLASHSADRLYKCNKCIKSFISKRHLRIHKATHKSEFKCGVCKQTFKQALHLRVHLKTHQRLDQNSSVIQSDSIEIKVKEEGNESNENDTLNCRSDYDETKDEAKKPQNYCKDCNKKVRSLLSHYLQHHNKTKPENADKQNLCPHCGKRFRTSSKLTIHIRTHTGESPYKCRYCDKWVKTRNILIVHERTHTGEKPYMCTICGKSFAQSSVLNTHTRIHTGRPEQCTICEKRFCRPAELRLHMRKHTGEKPYKCQHCGLGFKQKSHLVEHTKTHNDDRPYQCEFCEKAFKNHGTLKCHLQIHSGQKPFKCSQCSYACRQPYSLTQHMVQHDDDKPQLDYPHKCEICQRNFATTAHLTAHYNRFHPDLKVKFSETLEQQPTDNNQIIKSDTINDHEANQSDSNNYQRSQESQIQSSESELVESVGNVDTIIIQTEIQDGGEIKYEPIEIQFSTFQHEL